MTTQRLWPNVNASGVSLTVLAEDGVTVMSPFGNDVTLVQEVEGGPEVLPAYYRKLVYNVGTLLTYDPLGLSGDPITVPPVTRISAGTVAVPSDELSAYEASGEQLVRSSGYSETLDSGGDEFFLDPSDNTTTVDNIITFSAPSSGRYKRANRDPIVDLKKAGVNGSGTGNQATAIANAIAAALDLAEEGAPDYASVLPRIVVPAGFTPRVEEPISVPGNAFKRIVVTGGGHAKYNSNAYGDASWAASDPGCGGSLIKVAPGVTAFDLTTREMFFRDVGFLGINGGGTRIGVNATNGRVTFNNCAFFNLTTGVKQTNVISPNHSQNVSFWACQLGMDLAASTDHSYAGVEFQSCTVGMEINGSSIGFPGRTLFQNCGTGIYIDGGVQNLWFMQAWFEGNTSYDVNLSNPLTGQLHAYFGPGSRWASAGYGAAPIPIRGGFWNFVQNEYGPTFAQTSGYVNIHGSPEFYNSTFTDGEFQMTGAGIWANRFPTVSAGSLSMNFFVNGRNPVVLNPLTGNLTVNVPTNWPRECPISLELKQDGTGGRTVSFPGFNANLYSNTGNAADARIVITMNKHHNSGPYIESTSGWFV